MTCVSFVVTVYNKAAFLPDVIAAIKAQTGEFEREYVFVNDGSTDQSLDVVKAETQDLENVVLVDQKNQGVAIATNNGVAAAKGDYIKLVDADDILAPFATELLLKTSQGTQCDFTLGISGEYNDKSAIVFDEPVNARVKVFADPLLLVIDKGYARVSHCLFKKAYFDEAGCCDERIFSQDHSLFIRLSALGQLSQVYHDVCVSPMNEPGRIMNNTAQVVHDATIALAYHLSDNEKITARQRATAQKKIVSRAWKWAKKVHKISYFSIEFALYILVRCGARLSSDHLIDLCGVFRKNANVRRP